METGELKIPTSTPRKNLSDMYYQYTVKGGLTITHSHRRKDQKFNDCKGEDCNPNHISTSNWQKRSECKSFPCLGRLPPYSKLGVKL